MKDISMLYRHKNIVCHMALFVFLFEDLYERLHRQTNGKHTCSVHIILVCCNADWLYGWTDWWFETCLKYPLRQGMGRDGFMFNHILYWRTALQVIEACLWFILQILILFKLTFIRTTSPSFFLPFLSLSLCCFTSVSIFVLIAPG